MENREILIANTKTQKRSKVTTNATTLGELKVALDNAGIDYGGMTFTEGISKTQLLGDETQLPQNVIYKGQPTNNLVILLTNTKKNISSGAGSRKEAYDAIKANDLAEDIKEAFGTNYTHVSTANLWDFIDGKVEAIPEEEAVLSTSEGKPVSVDFEKEEKDLNEEEEEKKNPDEQLEELLTYPLYDAHSTILAHIVMLAKTGVLNADDVWELKGDMEALYDILNVKEKGQVSQPVSTSDGNINDDDIDNMMEELNL